MVFKESGHSSERGSAVQIRLRSQGRIAQGREVTAQSIGRASDSASGRHALAARKDGQQFNR